MKIKLFLTILISTCLGGMVHAQITNPRYLKIINDPNKLRVGDKVPEIIFEKIINTIDTNHSTAAYKGKAIIFDFWATWCSGCVSATPKMQKIQAKYDKRLKIFLVNTSTRESENESNLMEFLRERKKNGKEIDLPIILASSESKIVKYFPRVAIPHYVWIGADRRVKAITGYHELEDGVIEKNLELFISGQDMHLTSKEY